MCKQLEQETDIASWTENGGLFVGTNAERLAEYKRFAETGKYFGIEAWLKHAETGLKVRLQVLFAFMMVLAPWFVTISPVDLCYL